MDMNDTDKQVIRNCFCETLREPQSTNTQRYGFDKNETFTDELFNRILKSEQFDLDQLKYIKKNLVKLFTQTEDLSGIGYYHIEGKRIKCRVIRSLDLTNPSHKEKHLMNEEYKKHYHHWVLLKN